MVNTTGIQLFYHYFFQLLSATHPPLVSGRVVWQAFDPCQVEVDLLPRRMQ